jgi:indole-3-acetate monooxygenase
MISPLSTPLAPAIPARPAQPAPSTSPRVFTYSSTAETRDWLARVAEVAPLIEAYRDQADRDRAMPRPVFEALRDRGFTRMWVSTAFGGNRVSLGTGVAVLEALARLDASVAWQMCVQGAIGRLSDYLPEASAREMFAGQDGLVVGGGANPTGCAEPVDGGYRLRGTWAFASGSAHAGWLVCAAKVVRDGHPTGEVVLLFVPNGTAELRDTWHTLGLHGTGSNHYHVDDAFVPAEFAVDRDAMLRSPVGRGSRGYALGFYEFAPLALAPTPLGTARAALDAVVAQVPKLAQSPTAQEKLARAEALVHSARLLLMDTTRQAERSGEHGGDALGALIQLTAATVAEHCVSAVTTAYELAGAAALYDGNPVQRCFRDIHTAVMHYTLSPSNFELAGRYLLGGERITRR